MRKPNSFQKRCWALVAAISLCVACALPVGAAEQDLAQEDQATIAQTQQEQGEAGLEEPGEEMETPAQLTEEAEILPEEGEKAVGALQVESGAVEVRTWDELVEALEDENVTEIKLMTSVNSLGDQAIAMADRPVLISGSSIGINNRIELVGGGTNSKLSLDGSYFSIGSGSGALTLRDFELQVADGVAIFIQRGGQGKILTLENITMRDSGGALLQARQYAAGFTMEMEIINCLFENNTVGGPGNADPLISVINSRGEAVLDISECRFINNRVNAGGIVYSGTQCTTYISSSTFSGNSQTKDGGAVVVDGDRDLMVTGSTFSGNYTDGSGGAICIQNYNADVALFIEGSEFDGNRAAVDGGAIWLPEASILGKNLQLKDIVFRDNQAGEGYTGSLKPELDLAGVFVNVTPSYGTHPFNNDDVNANPDWLGSDTGITGTEVSTWAEFVAAVQDPDVDTIILLSDILVETNEPGRQLQLNNREILITGTEPGWKIIVHGGSWFEIKGTNTKLAFEDVSFDIRGNGFGSVRLLGLDITHNTTLFTVGEYGTSHYIEMEDCIFHDSQGSIFDVNRQEAHTTSISSGGCEYYGYDTDVPLFVLYAVPGGMANLTTIEENFHDNTIRAEGLINSSGVSSVVVRASEFKNNVTDGGAITTASHRNLSVKNNRVNSYTVFENNTSTGQGGAIYIKDGAAGVTIENTIFTGNQAQNGGAIHSEVEISVKNTTFTDNTAAQDGGAIYMPEEVLLSGGLSTNDVTFSGNRAQKGYDADIRSEYAALLQNITTTVASNGLPTIFNNLDVNVNTDWLATA